MGGPFLFQGLLYHKAPAVLFQNLGTDLKFRLPGAVVLGKDCLLKMFLPGSDYQESRGKGPKGSL